MIASGKILMLEDRKHDALLIQKALKRNGIENDTLVVSTRNGFIDALNSFSPLVIISDHQLPQFSSTEALDISREIYPYVPFILVTGTVSEEFAASIIRLGADDYILKNNLNRLPTAILQAVDKKNTQKSLSISNERYELVSKATSDAVWDWNITENTLTWNHGLQTLFGYDPALVIVGTRMQSEYIHPDDYPEFVREINKAFESKSESWIAIYRYRHHNGSYRHVFDRAHIIYRDNIPVRMIGAMQDVDDRVKASEEVKNLSIVASSTGSSVLILDGDLRIEWLNESFTKLSGYALKEVAGKTPFEFLHGPETSAESIKVIIEKSQMNKTFSEEILNYRKDGGSYWVNTTITPILNAEQQIYKYVAILTDITERKEHEKAMISIALELTSLIENSHAPIFGFDTDGNIDEWNKYTANLTGIDKANAIGKNLIFLLDGAVGSKFKKHLRNALEGEACSNCEIPFVNADGAKIMLSMSISPRLNSNKKIKGAICVGQDITEIFHNREELEKMVEERTGELNVALQKEKELVNLKSKFVSIASHEFRTPLSTISLASESILKYFDRFSGEGIKSKVVKIKDQANHMTLLLEDILTIGKSEAGKIVIQNTDFNLKDFIESLIEEVQSAFKVHRNVNFTFSSSLVKVNLDDKLLRNIIINLLTNAIKFSKAEKSVGICVSDNKDGIQMDVSDEGIGIASDELESVFESFQRGSNVSNIQGTGLGLSILKKSIELMHGSIEVQSVINVGSTFIVKIPVT